MGSLTEHVPAAENNVPFSRYRSAVRCLHEPQQRSGRAGHDKLEESMSVDRPAKLARGTDYLSFWSGIFKMLCATVCFGRSAAVASEVHNPADALVRYTISFVEWLGLAFVVVLARS
jgi:hypothetical protein